jgi:cobalamin biosynthesis protein CobT
MPVSLRTLEQKLYRREFKNMSELESWLRRMVKNAKDYYSRHSEVFEDAERIRKAVSNYMTKTNPAYKKIPSYSCQPAPIPDTPLPLDDGEGQGEDQGEEDAEGEQDDEAEADDANADEDEGDEEDEEEEDDDEDDGDDDADSDADAQPKRRGPGRPSIRGKVKPDHEYEGVPYKGLTFQQAQEKIVEEMIRKPDDE